jgi:hypothetical protein
MKCFELAVLKQIEMSLDLVSRERQSDFTARFLCFVHQFGARLHHVKFFRHTQRSINTCHATKRDA